MGSPTTQRFAVFRHPENPPESWRSWSAYTRDFNTAWRGFVGFYEGHGATRRERKADAIKRARADNRDPMDGIDPTPPAPADIVGSPETCKTCGMPPSAGRHANFAYCGDPCHATTQPAITFPIPQVRPGRPQPMRPTPPAPADDARPMVTGGGLIKFDRRADDAPRESAPASGEVFVYRPASWKGQAPDDAKGRDDVKWVCRRADDASGAEALAPGCHEHVALWDAINAYSAACGGHPTRGGGARMDAVVRVEKALRAALRRAKGCDRG